MNHAQEQSDEVEALSSIFMDDYNEISKSPYEFEITLLPVAPGSDQEIHVTARLHVVFAPKYPEVVPTTLTVSNVKGLSSSQIAGMQQTANRMASETVGSPLIYILADALKEYLASHNVKEKTMHESMMERVNLKQDEKDELKRIEDERLAAIEAAKNVKKVYISPVPAGTLVTLESFAAWKKTFDVEVKAANDLKEKAIKDALAGQAQKFTGREIFQKNLVKSLGLDEDGQGGKEGEDEVFWFNDDIYDADDAAAAADADADADGDDGDDAAAAADGKDGDADGDADGDDGDGDGDGDDDSKDAKRPPESEQTKTAPQTATRITKGMTVIAPATATATSAAGAKKPAAAAATAAPTATATAAAATTNDSKRSAAPPSATASKPAAAPIPKASAAPATATAAASPTAATAAGKPRDAKAAAAAYRAAAGTPAIATAPKPTAPAKNTATATAKPKKK